LKYEITVEIVHPLTLAAVRATVPAGGVAAAWKPALDKVWAFLRANRALGPGHNVFLYHHPERPGEATKVDFRVQVSNRFEDEHVACVETPSGEVARTVHVGPYERLGDAHAAIHQWCKTNKRKIAAASWEIYGDWNNDSEKLETTITYLLG
jgi:effector-binding domain-containing protein